MKTTWKVRQDSLIINVTIDNWVAHRDRWTSFFTIDDQFAHRYRWTAWSSKSRPHYRHCHNRQSSCPSWSMKSLIIDVTIDDRFAYRDWWTSLSRLTIKLPIMIDWQLDYQRHDWRSSCLSWSMDVIVTINNRIAHGDQWTAWSLTSGSTIKLPIVIKG